MLCQIDRTFGLQTLLGLVRPVRCKVAFVPTIVVEFVEISRVPALGGKHTNLCLQVIRVFYWFLSLDVLLQVPFIGVSITGNCDQSGSGCATQCLGIFDLLGWAFGRTCITILVSGLIKSRAACFDIIMVDFEFKFRGFLIHILSFIVTLGYDLPGLVGLILDIFLLLAGQVQGSLLKFCMSINLQLLYDELKGESSRWGDLIWHLCLPQVHFSHLQQAWATCLVQLPFSLTALLIIDCISYWPVWVLIKFYLSSLFTIIQSSFPSLLLRSYYNLLKFYPIYISDHFLIPVNPQGYNNQCKVYNTDNIVTREMKRKDKYEVESQKKQSLMQVQKELLGKVLTSGEGGLSWKILIFDAYNRAIVSSQLKMKDLRDQNITLYLSLNENRQQIHGVTIVYLVQPTLENIDIIANDLLDDMYTSVYIHFSSEPSPNILSTLAKKLTASKKSQVVSRILKIQYSCFGYYSIDHSMCILPTQVQITNLLTALTCQPIFIYNPSSQQSKSLVERIKSKFTSLAKSFEKQTVSSSLNYAIFYIFNRESDYFPVLSHGITYASLLQNIYKISKTGSKVTKGKETFELSLQDEIWLNKKNYLISEMKLGEQSNELSSKLIGLSSEQYTENNEKFKKIQWHLSNAGEMINEAKNRRLNEFNEVEFQIYNKGIISKETKRDILMLLKEAAEAQDKVRLLLIYIMYADNIDEAPQFEAVFPDILKNAKYSDLKQKKQKGSAPESASNKYIKKFAKGIWKNLMVGDKKFRVTKQLQKVKSCDFSQLIESGLAVEAIGSIPANLKIHRNIVYSLGGACFHEYGNLMEFNPDAIYASDQLISFRQAL